MQRLHPKTISNYYIVNPSKTLFSIFLNYFNTECLGLISDENFRLLLPIILMEFPLHSAFS